MRALGVHTLHTQHTYSTYIQVYIHECPAPEYLARKFTKNVRSLPPPRRYQTGEDFSPPVATMAAFPELELTNWHAVACLPFLFSPMVEMEEGGQ